MIIDDLFKRLKELSDVAPQGAHNKVCKEMNISISYSKILRSEAPPNSTNNIDLIERMIIEYIKIIETRADELFKVLEL